MAVGGCADRAPVRSALLCFSLMSFSPEKPS
jgi:hypothetical protein